MTPELEELVKAAREAVETDGHPQAMMRLIAALKPFEKQEEWR